MKKFAACIISICIAVSLILCLLDNTQIINAKEGTDSVVYLTNAECTEGEEFSIYLMLDSDKTFTDIGLEIGYNSELFRLESIINNVPEAMYTAAQTTTANPYNMGWSSIDGIKYSGRLATLTFTVLNNIQDGDYYIGVDYYKGRFGDYADGIDVNYDDKDESLGLTYNSGIITVHSYDPSNPTSTPTATPKVTDTPIASDTPKETADPNVTADPDVTSTPKVTDTPISVPTPTLEPEPMVTSTNSPAPQQPSAPVQTQPVNPNQSVKPADNIKKPGKVKLIGVVSSKQKKVLVRWKSCNVTGYQVQYALNKKFTKGKKNRNISGQKNVTVTLSKLISKKTYYVHVRAFNKSNGKTKYGAWSKVKKCKVI